MVQDFDLFTLQSHVKLPANGGILLLFRCIPATLSGIREIEEHMAH